MTNTHFRLRVSSILETAICELRRVAEEFVTEMEAERSGINESIGPQKCGGYATSQSATKVRLVRLVPEHGKRRGELAAHLPKVAGNKDKTS